MHKIVMILKALGFCEKTWAEVALNSEAFFNLKFISSTSLPF